MRLASGQLHAEHLAPAFPVNAERNEHRLGLDHPVEPDLLVPRIEDHIRIRFLEAALGKAPEQLIQPFVDPADRARRERVPAQLLGDRLDLARRHALDVHLGQRAHERLLRPLVSVEELGREPALPVTGHPQLQLPNARDQTAAVVPRPIPGPIRRALTGPGPHRLGHLRLQHLLEGFLQESFQQLVVAADQGFDLAGLRGTLRSRGHGHTPL